MIIEGQAFSPCRISSFPPLLSIQQVVSLSQSFCVSPVGENGGGGAKSYDGEKALSFIYIIQSVFGTRIESDSIQEGKKDPQSRKN